MIKSTIIQMGYFIQNIHDFWLFKLMSSVVVVVFSFLFDVQLAMPMLSIVVLVIFDMITGIMSAYRAGEIIKSKLAFRSAIKLFVYAMLVSGAYLTGEYLIHMRILDDVMLGFIGLTEIISLIENAGKMGYAIPKKMLNRLEEFRDNTTI